MDITFLQEILEKHHLWLKCKPGGVRANLSEANLRGADLRGADLRGADLREADLSEVDLPGFQICPEEGSFIAWKKINDTLIKLEIPARAKRTSSLVGRKCRASYVKVVKIYGKEKTITGGYDNKTTYTEGEITRPNSYNEDIRIECTHGIHFFITRKEAEKW